jgi:hypothetical protein
MLYDVRYPSNRIRIIDDAMKIGEECPVDDICESIPLLIQYIIDLEEKNKENKSEIQKLNASVKEYERKLNNLKSQKFRILKKKGKTLHD